MRIQVLGAHNCESQTTRLVSLLIDDILAIDAGALTSNLSLPAQQKLKAILLTHAHYDHIRDVPAIAMNAFFNETTINIYSTPDVYDKLAAYLLNDKLYPAFLERPRDNPTIKFTTIDKAVQIDGYNILAVPVNHSIPTVGYQVTAPDGKTVFYTSDTGPGLADCWQQVSPQLLIIEVTAPNKHEEFTGKTGHLTPNLLKQELECFRALKGYLPEVVTVHMNPRQEKEIETEIRAVARSLNTSIRLAYKGMLLHL